MNEFDSQGIIAEDSRSNGVTGQLAEFAEVANSANASSLYAKFLPYVIRGFTNGALLARIWQSRDSARFRFASVRGDIWFL